MLQKTSKLIKKLAHLVNHEVFKKHIVLIFDECHRSQFGKWHKKITDAFKKYHIFGFTGTPIFADNAQSGGNIRMKTTPQVFGGESDEKGNRVKPLHSYTILNAINDNNVLPFLIDYTDTIKIKEDIEDKKVKDIDKKSALESPRRISSIVEYILEHFDQKTKRISSYEFNKLFNISDVVTNNNKVQEIKTPTRVSGFNSIFAVDSIRMAMKYYAEFKEQLNKSGNKLKIATIFSFSANEEDSGDITLDEESFDTEKLDKSSRDFLECAIKEYNETFNTNYDTSADKFQNYYKDVSLRMKNREIDLLIVVNMFLTGFDATTLNTLWVDRNLKYHGLIQAFSRTNRILNSVKTFGHIICFRDLVEDVDKAIALFESKKAGNIIKLKTYQEYFDGYIDDNGKIVVGYSELIEKIKEMFPLGQDIIGESDQKDFILLFGKILKLRNILTAFDEFKSNDKISERDLQDYQSIYLDLHYKYTNKNEEDKENICDNVIFEIELIKQVRSVRVFL